MYFEIVASPLRNEELSLWNWTQEVLEAKYP